MLGPLRLAPLLLALVLTAGCSGDGSSPDEPAAPEVSESSTAPTTTESSAPAADDVDALLLPGADLSQLADQVVADLDDLTSVHIRQAWTGGQVGTFEIDASDEGRCSGEADQQGMPSFRFVTTSDARLLVATDDPDRWVEAADYVLGEQCAAGPRAVVLGTTSDTEGTWPWVDAERVGEEKVDGQPAVHFRKSAGGVTIDTWIAVEDGKTRLLKMVRNHQDSGNRLTQDVTAYDAADEVLPEPPAGQVDSRS